MEFERRPSGLLVPKIKKTIKEQIIGRGTYFGSIRRNGEIIDEFEYDNTVVNQGLNDNLNCYLGAGSQTTSWFMGIFQGNYTPVPTDTAATIAGNSTECSSYTNATRPQWQSAAASGQSITNAANRATFTFNASVTVYGAFLISNNTIAGTSGTLFSASLFGAPKAVSSGDQLLLTYQFGASNG